MTAKLVVLATLILGLAATAALGLVARGPGCCDALSGGDPALTRAYIRVLDDAISAGDAAKAVRAWRDVWVAALATRRWDALITAGDQALRIGELTEAREPARADARQAYHSALFRAYGQRSAEGVLRAAEAMALAGDREMTDGALQLARKLAARTPDADVRAWIEQEVIRIAADATTTAAALPRAAAAPAR